MSPLKALMARMSYHVGRLSAYMSLGYVFGYFGWGVRWAGMQQWLSIAIGLLMLTLVFFQHNLGYICNAGLVGKIEKSSIKVIQQKSLVGFGTLGLLNGYLPCGILYIALAGAAATSTPVQGSIYMLMYGLGTVPALLLVSYLPHLLKGTFRLKFQKIVPIYTLCLLYFLC
jgi:sulfite exporter TauE/SafE